MLISHDATQRGYDAVALFKVQLSALPAHDVGYRFYLSYPGGCVRRAIHSDNDLFFLLLFVAAIGFDDKVVKKEDRTRARCLGHRGGHRPRLPPAC